MSKKRAPRVGLNISAEDFVRAWQSSGTVEEACIAISKKSGTNASPQSVRQRARTYRVKGVMLKEMPRSGGGRRQDWSALKALAKSLVSKSSKSSNAATA